MFRHILNLFAAPETPRSHESKEERLRVATCVLLVEVAGADEEFAPEECERIIEILRRRFDLTQDEAEDLLRVSQEKASESSDLWKFTNQLNQNCTPAEKQQVVEEIWRVIFADGNLDAHEDYVIHKLARLLNLDHPQLIEAKMRAREGSGL